MKLPLTWLKEFINYSISDEALAKRLTDVGLEVEEVLKDSKGKTILGLNITPNRGDALSVLGLAREVSAILEKPIQQSKTKAVKLVRKTFTAQPGNFKNEKVFVNLKLSHPKQCPRYMMAVFKNVKVEASPEWLQHRLEQVGIRSINNIVDITNYILMAYGQPLHAFDRQKIKNSQIIIRTAKAGEKILTLDAKEHELISSDLVIADLEKPLALAGIMGGLDSEITSNTSEIALECAWFDPSTIRKTARRLGIQTDSSYRFERSVDFNIQNAFFEAIRLIQEVAQADLVGEVSDLYPKPFVQKKIKFSPTRLERVIGGTWKHSEFKKIFSNLGFIVKESKKDLWDVTVPSWRADVSREEDLFEEIVRSAGLDRIPATFPKMTAPPMSGNVHELLSQEEKVKELLTSLEFHEAIHFSFISPEEVLLIDSTLEDQLIHVTNPLGHEFSIMRPTLLPSLLKTLQYHHRHKITRARFFELRNRFIKTQDGMIERKALSAVLSGVRAQADCREQNAGTDFFEVKGIISKIVKLAQRHIQFITPQEKIVFLHPGKQIQIAYQHEDQTIEDLGVLGELHPEIALKMDFKHPVYLFELDWTGLMDLPKENRSFVPYSDQPVVLRDLALLMESDRTAGDLMPLLQKQDPSIRKIKIFDVYEGEKLPIGKKSVAYSLELGLENRTMTEEEINQVMQKIMNYLRNSLGIEIR